MRSLRERRMRRLEKKVVRLLAQIRVCPSASKRAKLDRQLQATFREARQVNQ